MFRINEVISFKKVLYRVLAIRHDDIVWIQIDDASAFPTLITKRELEDAIDNELLTREQDPFAYLSYENPDEGSSAWEKREQNYQLILPLITDENFYTQKARSAFINSNVAEQKATKQTLYRLLRRYWQRGQTPNALIPDYRNSGAKGKKRKAKDKKLGRPRKHLPGTGAIVDEHIERLFRIAIEKYFLTEKKHTLTYSHRRFKSIFETHYPETPESEIPTLWQMKHFYHREYGAAEKIQRRSHKIDFNKDIRPLHSTASASVMGPGSRFEIDATIADIYLVSDSDRRNIVGRPVVYIVVDVFSRMIAGFYIGLESPSYAAAIQALSMAMTDKVSVCKKYGIDISEEDWPVVGVPDAILADRGELLGHQIESLEKSFSVRIENTPPYRGDAKGIVERSFKTIQAEFKPFAPGVVTETKVKKRGGSDYRLDAALTVHEFTEIILASILFRNSCHPLEKYDREADMPSDLPMTPLSLWNWGVQHRTGRLRVVPEDALRISLFPKTKATFSELGVCVFGVYYTSQELLKRGWMHRGQKNTRPDSLEAAYDPGDANQIYLFPRSNNSEYWTCGLTQRCREYSDSSFWDVWRISDEKKKTVAKSKLASEKKRRELDQQIESKIETAKKLRDQTESLPSSKRIKAIRKNRESEKDLERRKKAGVHNKDEKSHVAKVIPISNQSDDYSYPDMIDELFDEED